MAVATDCLRPETSALGYDQWILIRFANGLAGGASAVSWSIENSTSRKTGGLRRINNNALFSIWFAASHALTGIYNPASEVAHALSVCLGGSSAPVSC